MIDINELRRKLHSGDIVDHVDIHANVRPVLTELLDRLEAAERERDALRAAVRHEADCVEAAMAGIVALRAKITEMEQQEPVAWYSKQYGFVYMSRHSSQFEHGSILYLRNGTPAWRIEGSSKVALLDMASLPHGTVFYAIPGAKGE